MTNTTASAVLDGTKMTNEQLGGLTRRCDEVKRRINEGTLPYDWVMDALQQVVEGPQSNVAADFTKLVVAERSQPAPLPMSITINADLNPNIPSGLYLEGEGTEHRKMGEITLEKREDGKLYINGVEATLYLSPKQMNGKTIQGHKLRKELKDQKVLNACIFDALRANPHLIPEDWKQDEQGRTRYIFFWGTIFCRADGALYVEYVYWHDGKWRWDYLWLGFDWDVRRPAASLAS